MSLDDDSSSHVACHHPVWPLCLAATLLQEACVVHDMASAVDYRRLARHAAGVYFLAPDRGDALHAAFLEAGEISGNGSGRGVVGQPGPATVDVAMGRTLVVPQALGAHMLCVQLHTTICRAVLRMLYAMYHVLCYVLHVTTCPCESPPFAAFPCCPWSVQSPPSSRIITLLYAASLKVMLLFSVSRSCVTNRWLQLTTLHWPAPSTQWH
jgi:hypothetical protein